MRWKYFMAIALAWSLGCVDVGFAQCGGGGCGVQTAGGGCGVGGGSAAPFGPGFASRFQPPRLSDSRQQELLAQGFTPGGDGSFSRRLGADMQPITTQTGGCSTGSCGVSSLRGRTGGWNPAPRSDASPPAPIAETKPTIPAPSQAVDMDALAAKIAATLAADPRFRGPKGDPGEPGQDGQTGPQGLQGPPGKDADPEAIAQLVLARIDYAAIAARISPPAVNVDEKIHYVVVADRAASYWPRLSGEVQTASESYRGIEVVEPGDQFSGQMPQLIEYRGRSPKVLARGQADVSSSLALISRGSSL